MNNSFLEFKKIVASKFKFKIFLFKNLPVVLFSGIQIQALTEQHAIISVKQKWFNKNPFRSIYFATLSMAAELSTGVLCMGNIYKSKPAVSMLVIKTEADFYKKATGKILFTCSDGELIKNNIAHAIETQEAVTVKCHSSAVNENNETIADFYFTWSFKIKTKK